eukprot:2871128-Rhodomonas_salina.4
MHAAHMLPRGTCTPEPSVSHTAKRKRMTKGGLDHVFDRVMLFAIFAERAVLVRKLMANMQHRTEQMRDLALVVCIVKCCCHVNCQLSTCQHHLQLLPFLADTVKYAEPALPSRNPATTF